MRKLTFYCPAIESREQLHRAFAEALAFPDYYGKNLDALYDCLTDLFVDTKIVLVDAGALTARMGVYGARVVRLLVDAAAENPRLHLRFAPRE